MEYKHFSHHHPLTLHRVEAGQQFRCHGCELPCHDSIFACWRCGFFLHDHCGNANRYVKHPSHPLHPLILTPTPTYCSGSFICDGCGSPGSSFSYCCALCEVDLHVHCAYLPPKVVHGSHPHEMRLDIRTVDKTGPTQNCGICRKETSMRHWRYVCEKPECDFRAHTYCATREVKPGLYQDDEPEDQVSSAVPPNDPNACMYQIQVPADTSEEVLAEMFLRLQVAQQLNQMFNPPRS